MFYNKQNDAIFNPVQINDFTKDFYLLAAENNLTVDDLTTPTKFDPHRKYYKIEDNQIVYYPTIQQIIEDGHNYYFYKPPNRLLHELHSNSSANISNFTLVL